MTRPWLLVSGDFVRFGGMDAANFALATHLAATGHEVHVVAHAADESLARRGVEVRRVARPLQAHILGMPLLTRAARSRARALAPRAPRVVANGGNLAWPGMNWVHYVHAAFDPCETAVGWSRVIARAERRTVLRQEWEALTSAEVVICNSRRTMADLCERVRVPAERLRLVYYGTDVGRFRPVGPDACAQARAELGWPSDRPVALFVGALGDRRKSFDFVFDSWRGLAATGWDVHLVVAGGGRELRSWQQRAIDAGLDRTMSFLGYRHDVDLLIAASDVMVHPARYEAYGLSAHEAACRGVPVIVSADAGVAERFPADLAPLMLHTGTADELVSTLAAWRSNWRHWRDTAARFSPEIAARSWSDMASEIVDIGEQL